MSVSLSVALVGCGGSEQTPVAGPSIPDAPSIPEIPPPPDLPTAEETPIEGAVWAVDGHAASIVDVQPVSGGRIAYMSTWADVGLLAPTGEVASRPVLNSTGWLASELDVSPDGAFLAAATNRGAETWDVETGLPFATLGTLSDVVAWSPGGGKIATSFRPAAGGRDGFIGLLVWDAQYGSLLRSVASDGGRYLDAVSWSPDGTRVAVAAEGFFVYDLELDEVVWRADGGGDHDDPLLWHPTGATVAHVTDSTVTLYDVDARERTSLAVDQPVTTGLWSDAEHLTLVAASGEVLELNVGSGQTTPVGTVPVSTLAFEPVGGGLAAIGTRTGEVGVWNVPDGREEKLVTPLPGRGESIAVSHDGAFLASGGDNGVVRVWRSSDGALVRERVVGERAVDAVAWSPDDRSIAVAHAYRIDLYDADTFELLATASDQYTDTVAFGRSGTLLTGSGELLDGTTLDEIGANSVAGAAAAWGPEDATIAVGSIDGVIDIVDAASGERIETIPTDLDAVSSLAWSGDGATVAAADYGTIVAIDAQTGATRFSVTYQGPLSDMTFSPDSSSLVTTTWPNAFDDGLLETVRFWNPVSGRVRFGVGGTSTAGGVALYPDGGRMALANWSGKVALLELPSIGVEKRMR